MYPTDLKDTVILMLTDELQDMNELEVFKETDFDDVIRYHYGLGTMIRNHYKLWDETEIAKYPDEFGFSSHLS